MNSLENIRINFSERRKKVIYDEIYLILKKLIFCSGKEKEERKNNVVSQLVQITQITT